MHIDYHRARTLSHQDGRILASISLTAHIFLLRVLLQNGVLKEKLHDGIAYQVVLMSSDVYILQTRTPYMEAEHGTSRL